MSVNEETTYIGNKKRREEQRVVSHEIEAMPTPNAWGVEPANAKEKGHLRVAKGKISFVRLDISLISRIPTYDEHEDAQKVLLSDLDPADEIIGEDQKRSVHSRRDNIDLFELEQQIKSKKTIVDNRKYNSNSSESDYNIEDGAEYLKSNYGNSKEAERIRFELSEKTKRLMFNLIELGAITVFFALIEIIPAFGLPIPVIFLPEESPVTYLLIELAGLLVAAYISLNDIVAGLKKIVKRKCNTRTVLAVAIIAEILHIIYMLASAIISKTPATNSFAAPICLAVGIYTVNRLMNTIRVARGFNFVSKHGIHCEVMAADDSPVAADLRLASGSTNAKISYVVRTRHLSAYFKNACRDDNCSIMMSRVYPYFLIASLATAIIGAIRGLFAGGDFLAVGFSALCASLVTSVPITGLLCLEIPLSNSVKRLLHHGALLNGWNAVEKFGDTDALAINTTDLFPRGSIKIRRAVAVTDMAIEDVTIIAASVVIASGGALAEAFSDLVSDEKKFINNVDGITYENELGISGWVKEKRILIGNSNMMETHRVIVPGGGLVRLEEFEAMKKRPGHQVLYVSVNNRLVGVYLLEYKASTAARNALVQLISDGTNIMLYTCDANINVELITHVFDIPARYISILDNDGSRTYDSVTYSVTDKEEAMLATNGTLKALSEGIRSAVKLKENQSLGLMIQTICFGMGFLFVAGLSCISSYAIDAAQIIVMQLVFILISLVSVIRAL